MRILIGMWHPAHVHTFRNLISLLIDKGHNIKIVATKKDNTPQLLELYHFNCDIIGQNHSNNFGKILDLVTLELGLLQISLKFKPDIFVGRGSLAMAHVSKLLRIPYIAFIDSEPAWIIAPFQMPFISAILTPYGYRRKIDPKKHIRVHSFKELAYLHPDQFVPDPSVLKELGLDIEDKFSLVRFVGWAAYHDLGEWGFSIDDKLELIDNLSNYGNVYISSEKELPPDLRKYELKIRKDRIHSILYYARIFIGDSQTMTTEAALLGTPAIRCNSFVGVGDMSNFIELEEKYGLIYNYRDADLAINKAVELLQRPEVKEEWISKRDLLLKDKINLTEFMVKFVEDYPQSFIKIKQNCSNK